MMERLFESLKLISNSVPTRDNRNSDRQFGSSDLFLGAADPAVASVAVFGGRQVILIGRENHLVVVLTSMRCFARR
jgi:hypothetical protein